MTGVIAAPRHLFVYGSLRSACDNPYARLLREESDYLGRASVIGRLYRVDWYPGLIIRDKDRGGGVVRGEVFRLRDAEALLEVIDSYEGCGAEDPRQSEFSRARTAAVLDSGEIVACWIYVYTGHINGKTLIESGDWAEEE
jgi:gamma-glutamylcyclotransferase (GGCT)/AIG2-like uncharacterized protein YtfP